LQDSVTGGTQSPPYYVNGNKEPIVLPVTWYLHPWTCWQTVAASFKWCIITRHTLLYQSSSLA